MEYRLHILTFDNTRCVYIDRYMYDAEDDELESQFDDDPTWYIEYASISCSGVCLPYHSDYDKKCLVRRLFTSSETMRDTYKQLQLPPMFKLPRNGSDVSYQVHYDLCVAQEGAEALAKNLRKRLGTIDYLAYLYCSLRAHVDGTLSTVSEDDHYLLEVLEELLAHPLLYSIEELKVDNREAERRILELVCKA